MDGLASRPGIASAATAGAIVAQLAAGAWLFDADGARVYVLGRPIQVACALRQRYGLPCPTCGISRSLVLSVHGRFAEAWRVAPVGLVLIGGLAVFAAMMLVLAMIQWRGAARCEHAIRTWIPRAAWIYAGAAAAVWLGGWAIQFYTAIRLL